VQEGEESESQTVRKASINLPVAGVLDTEKGGFKPVEELRATFEAAGLLDPTKKVVTYCGCEYNSCVEPITHLE
jgi:3-mercaptopyruvate sulfurtransferase SseA